MKNLKMTVEIPTGSANKYEFNTVSKEWELDRVLYGAMNYPCEYGFIPQTIDYDGDPLDILCLVSQPTFPGCTITTRVVGILRMIDQGELDYKLIAVNATDNRFRHVEKLADLGPGKLDEISNFFLRYKEIEKKDVVIEGYGDQQEAESVLEECYEMFKACQTNANNLSKAETVEFLRTRKEKLQAR